MYAINDEHNFNLKKIHDIKCNPTTPFDIKFKFYLTNYLPKKKSYNDFISLPHIYVTLVEFEKYIRKSRGYAILLLRISELFRIDSLFPFNIPCVAVLQLGFYRYVRRNVHFKTALDIGLFSQ